MRIAKLFTAAAASVALMATPVVAAPQASAKSAASTIGARAGAMSNADDELFRGRKKRGGVLVFILIAIVIAVGIYIIVDDEDDEDPISA